MAEIVINGKNIDIKGFSDYTLHINSMFLQKMSFIKLYKDDDGDMFISIYIMDDTQHLLSLENYTEIMSIQIIDISLDDFEQDILICDELSLLLSIYRKLREVVQYKNFYRFNVIIND